MAFFGRAGYFHQRKENEHVRQWACEEARQPHRAEEAVFRMRLEKAEELLRADDSRTALAVLARLVRDAPTNRIAVTRLFFALHQRNSCLPAVEPMRHSQQILSVQLSPDGTRLVTAAQDQTS